MRRATRLMARARLAFLLAVLCAHATAQDAAWPDTRENRMAALALIRNLNAEILASRSATEVLQKWCANHKLAENPRIVARVIQGSDKALSDEQRQRLQLSNTEKVRYRRVELRCGRHVLSVADNWYVPDRLTPEMNRLLDSTGTPFGTVVRALEPYRKTVAAKLLWSPIPPGLKPDEAEVFAATGATLVMPDGLFEHRAVLYTREHLPFSEVHEVYQRHILAFPAPASR